MHYSNNCCSIQIGEACISFICSNKRVLERLRYLYSDFLSDSPADLSVEITPKDNIKPGENERPVGNPGFHHGDGFFHFSDNLVSGEYDFNSKRVRVRAPERLLTQDYGSYYLNQMMCLLYNSSLYIAGVDVPEAHMVHSAAVASDGYGLLFTGPSGIGKTTAAGMCAGFKNTVIINDEGNLVSRPVSAGDPAKIHGIPVIGKLPVKHNMTVPLSCILFLKQGKKTVLSRMNRTEAFKRLLFQVIGNAYFGQNDKKAIINSKVEFNQEITRSVPCYQLEFTLDRDELRDTLDCLKDSLSREIEVCA